MCLVVAKTSHLVNKSNLFVPKVNEKENLPLENSIEELKLE
jgi:hypothetical protein